MRTNVPGILAEVREGVAWITFDRPQKANAVTVAMLKETARLVAEYATDAAIRAAVLTGSGTRNFTAGADLTPVTENQSEHRAEGRAQFAAAMFALLDFPKPAVAAVNGAACGAGMMLALLCDGTVAASSARFSLPEINHGMPTLPGITIVGGRLDNALAADLVFSGRFMDAEEALRRGVANEIVANDQLAAAAQKLALTLSGKDARAYAYNKRWLNRPLRERLAAALKASAEFNT